MKCKPEDGKEFLSEPIHYNLNIVRDKKSLHISKWMENDIVRIGDLVDVSGCFYNYEDFQRKFSSVNTNFLIYYGVINAITSYKDKLNVSLHCDNVNELSNAWQGIMHGGNKFIYNMLIKSASVTLVCIEKWKQQCAYQLRWNSVFGKIAKTTTDTQLKWFQTRLLYRILPTQKYLYLLKIVDSPLCTFCNGEQETIIHLFWDCPFVQSFWVDILHWFMDKCAHCRNFSFSESLVLFGLKENVKTDKTMDLLILLGKYHIYKCKINKTIPNVNLFQKYVKQRFYIEKYMSTISGMFDKFTANWCSYRNLIDSIQ